MSTPPEMMISGIGLFSALPASVRILPSTGSSGLRFVHASTSRIVPATISNLRQSGGPLGGRNTVVGTGDWSIATVEHLLSALAGLGIWNADLVVDAGELPILDGSAAAFAGVLARGLASSAPAREIHLHQPVRVEDHATGAWIEARPAKHLRYRYELLYPAGSGIPAQNFEWTGDAAVYAKEIAPARTFSLEREALAMKAAGLFPHLTPRDMLVIAPDGRAIDNSLRFPDEPARHKLLDLIGDLALLGGPLIAEVNAHKSSHALTHELCRRIAALQS